MGEGMDVPGKGENLEPGRAGPVELVEKLQHLDRLLVAEQDRRHVPGFVEKDEDPLQLPFRALLAEVREHHFPQPLSLLLDPVLPALSSQNLRNPVPARVHGDETGIPVREEIVPLALDVGEALVVQREIVPAVVEHVALVFVVAGKREESGFLGRGESVPEQGVEVALPLARVGAILDDIPHVEDERDRIDRIGQGGSQTVVNGPALDLVQGVSGFWVLGVSEHQKPEGGALGPLFRIGELVPGGPDEEMAIAGRVASTGGGH